MLSAALLFSCKAPQQADSKNTQTENHTRNENTAINPAQADKHTSSVGKTDMHIPEQTGQTAEQKKQIDFFNIFPPDAIAAMASKKIVSGEINQKFLDQVLNLAIDGQSEITVISAGGDTRFGMRIARIIDESNISISVAGVCASACAEYLLAATDNLSFIGRPVIAFHGNPLAHSYYVKKIIGKTAKACPPYFRHDQHFKALYEKRGLNYEFWQEQYKRLVIIDTTFTDTNLSLEPRFQKMVDQGIKIENPYANCKSVKIKTRYSAWLPTSRQLEKLLGLKFTGSLCADNLQTCKTRLNTLWPEGEQIIIGDKEFIISGK